MFYSASVQFIRFYIIILCTTHFISINCAVWTEQFPRNVTRFRRQANCGPGSLSCKTGECVNEDTFCDGKEDCRDGSDEDDCSNIPCTNPFLFKCDYGACISKSLRCDGKKDCKDNSDEKDCSGGSCGNEKFLCKNGECIDEIYLCDGKANCSDKSDETEEACKELGCPGSTYRCKYGGCISKAAECNGVADCIDGSDEASCPGGVPRPPVTPPTTPKPTPTPTGPPPPGYCTVPNNPSNGFYKLGDHTVQPGSFADPFAALILVCNRRYNQSPPNAAFPLCYNGAWTAAPPKCALACDPVESTATTNITCKFNGLTLNNCKKPVDGVEAKIDCVDSFHEEASLERVNFRFCTDGTWDNNFPECYPKCGQKRPKGTPQVVGGRFAEKGDYPWHVGIYQASDLENICGGSIIRDNIVISAAHCFSSLSNGHPFPPENYVVAAGKYYRTYNEPKDEEAQYSDVSTIFIPDRYKGEIQQYEADIAVLKLKTKFKFSSSVQPVCIDWTNKLQHQQFYGTKEGVVIGWGQTVEGSEPSEKLKELSLPVIPYERCFEEVPKDFRRFLTHDKVCAGHLEKGQSTCQGDSGGGLVFEDANSRFYLRGIVSTSPATGQRYCDSNQYGTYTLVSTYTDFIKYRIR